MIDLQKVFDFWGWSNKKKRSCQVVVGGPGVYNPLPFAHLIDYVCLSEKALVELITMITNVKQHHWRHPNLVWAKTKPNSNG